MTVRLVLALAWVLFAIAMLALIAMPTSGYDWMAQMDPAIAPGSIEDADNLWPEIGMIVLALALAAQALIQRLAVGRPVRILSAALMVAAVATWLVRFAI